MTSVEEYKKYRVRKKEAERKKKRCMLLILFLFIITTVLFTVIICAVGATNEATKASAVNRNIPVAEESKAEQTEHVIESAATEIVTDKSEIKYISLGEYRLTAYCSCEKCCGYWATVRPKDDNGNSIVYTASGKVAKIGYTVAADTNVLPFGTKVYINGHEYEVQDRGGAIKGNRIDVYFADHQEALNFGVQYAEVFIMVEAENG